ncbi:MAG: winged helix-turn-helix domain-containing protein [Sarcina sp.]
MLLLLEVLKDNEIYTNNQCVDILTKKLNIIEEEQKLCFPSGKKRIFYDRVNWVKTYIKKVGLVEAPKRGLVKITELGLELLKEKPTQIKSKDLLRYDSFYEFVDSSNREQNHNEDNGLLLNEKPSSEKIANAF